MFTSRIWRLQPIDDKNKEQQEIEKELNLTNLEDLFNYSFIYSTKIDLKSCQDEENGTIK